MTTPHTIEVETFRAMLCLPGWDDRSIWGWDGPTSTMFAQLWPNGDDSDDPPIVIPSGYGEGTRYPPTTDPATLVIYMVRATGWPDVRIVQAMQCHAPQALRDLFAGWLARAGL